MPNPFLMQPGINTAAAAFGREPQPPARRDGFASVAAGFRRFGHGVGAGFARDPRRREVYQGLAADQAASDEEAVRADKRERTEQNVGVFRELVRMATAFGTMTPSLTQMLDRAQQQHVYLTGDAEGAAQMGDFVRMAAAAPREGAEPDYQNVLGPDGRSLGMLDINDPNVRANLPPGAQLGGTAPVLPGEAVQRYEFGRAAAGRSPGTTVVLPPQEGASAAAIGKAIGEQYADWQKSAVAASANIGKYQRLGALLSQVQTGKFKGSTNELKKAAEAAGFNLESWGITDDTAIVDAAQALSREMALQLRNPAGGAGMPGAMSDQDRAFLESMIASVETSPDAVPQIVGAALKVEQRNKDIARISRDYKRRNGGSIDDGVYDEIAAYAEANPLFTDADAASIGSMGTSNTDNSIPTFSDPNDPKLKAMPAGSVFRDGNGVLRYR